jgi:Protein of unknown function (DUF1656)
LREQEPIIHSANSIGAKNRIEPVHQSARIALLNSIFTNALLGLSLNNPEFRFMDLLVPWIFVIGVIGFMISWLIAMILERTGMSRKIWHFPLFFVALFVLVTCLLGYIFSP